MCLRFHFDFFYYTKPHIWLILLWSFIAFQRWMISVFSHAEKATIKHCLLDTNVFVNTLKDCNVSENEICFFIYSVSSRVHFESAISDALHTENSLFILAAIGLPWTFCANRWHAQIQTSITSLLNYVKLCVQISSQRSLINNVLGFLFAANRAKFVLWIHVSEMCCSSQNWNCWYNTTPAHQITIINPLPMH